MGQRSETERETQPEMPHCKRNDHKEQVECQNGKFGGHLILSHALV